MELSFYGILEGFMQVSTIGNNATQPWKFIAVGNIRLAGIFAYLP
jgi:hypothetical protein